MQAQEIKSADDLEAWLKTLPPEQGIIAARQIAHRAALRALPSWAQFCATKTKTDLKSVPVFWCHLLSAVRVGDATVNIESFSAAAAAAAAAAYKAAAPASAYDAAFAAAFAAAYDAAYDAASDVSYAFRAASIADAVAFERGFDLRSLPLWPDGADPLAKNWAEAAPFFARHPAWAVFTNLYENALHARPQNLPLLIELAQQDEDFWTGPDVEVLDRIAQVVGARALANAAPVDFTFDTLAKVMRMIGVTDHLRHLRNPAIVQAFLDDAEQVRDLFQDFVDDAQALSGGGNFAGVLRRKANNVLKEFQRTQDHTHLRADYLVLQASELELFSKEAKARSDLGDLLASRLDDRIGQLKHLCRRHFSPSYLSLAPLADLSFDQIDQGEVIRILDDAIEQMGALPSDDLYPLDPEGMAVLHDMLRDLVEFKAAIAEASSAEFRAILEQRLAQSAGALGLTLTKFYERSYAAGQNTMRSADVAIRAHQRVNGLGDIMAIVADMFKSGGA